MIDAGGKIVMPGLINTHAHIAMSIFRETLDGYTLQDWLTKKIWPMEDRMTADDIYWASLLSFVEMVSTETVQKCVALAKKYDVPVHVHFCENAQEVADIKNNYGVESPMEVLEKYCGGVHTILAHGVKLSEAEIERLSKLDVAVAHNPVSNLRLACGVAKAQYMMDKGVNVALGTDGQGSGSSMDLFEQMKFAALLQKGEFEDAGFMNSYDVLKMATINGAKALGVSDEIGSIEEGKAADIIMVDLDSVCCQPTGNVFSDLVYNAKGSNVRMTMVGGKIVMRDGEVFGVDGGGITAGIDKSALYKKCAEIIERIS